MLKNKRFVVLAIFATILCSFIGAQTNSPYSRYGYGVIHDQATGVSKGMGGVRYGIRNSLSANAGNPASYSHVDSLTFLFDLGLYAEKAKLSDNSGSRTDWNGGLSYITFLFPLTKNLGLSGGLLPISSVGYDFVSQGEEGPIPFIKSYEGKGGLSQIYLGLGYELPFVKGLSLGFNASYIFGKLEHRSSLAYLGGGVTSSTTAKDTDLRINSYKFDLGVQYNFVLNKDNGFTIGAVYTPKVNSKGSFKEINVEVGAETIRDTIRFSGANAGMPHQLGIGAAWRYKTKWTLAADLTYQHWKGVKYTSLMGDDLDQTNRFNNRWKYNLGTEFVANKYSRNFVDRMRFRGGVNYSKSYLNVKTLEDKIAGYDEYGATIGFGLPVFDRQSFGSRTSYVNINFDYKLLNPKTSSLVKEQYFGVSVSISFNELWFYKRKIQ